MAKNSIIRSFDSIEEDYNILASYKARAVIHKTLDLTFLQPDENGSKFVKQGSIYCTIPNSPLICVLPITRVTTAVAVSGTAVVVNDAKVFKVGGVLVVVRPYARITLAGTTAINNTISVVLQGQTYIYTLLAGDTTQALTAISLAAFLNAQPVFADRVTAVASASIVYLYSKTQVAYTLAVSVTGGGVTATASDAVMQENTVIGTIFSINPLTNTITLTSGSVIVLPIGAPIGIATEQSQIIGMACYRLFVDSTNKRLYPQSEDVAVYTEADVYTSLIPFWDRWISQALPQITSVARG